MKKYSCRVFKNLDDLLYWLNKEQKYINVVSIMYVDSSFPYEVIFYTEAQKYFEDFKNKTIEEIDKNLMNYEKL